LPPVIVPQFAQFVKTGIRARKIIGEIDRPGSAGRCPRHNSVPASGIVPAVMDFGQGIYPESVF
jgi:hypothetical protein